MKALRQGEGLPVDAPRGEFQGRWTAWLRQGTGLMAKRQLEKNLRAQQLLMLPARRLRRALEVLHLVGRHAQPKVHAALRRAYLGGWCTERRFGKRGPCKFCCRRQDSELHISACPIAGGWLRRWTESAPASGVESLDWLYILTLGPSPLRRAIGLYAVYEVHNGLRTGRITPHGAVAALDDVALTAGRC